MPPNIQARAEQPNGEIAEQSLTPLVKHSKSDVGEDVQGKQSKTPRHHQIVWRNVILMVYLHAAAAYGFYLCFTAAKWQTSLLGMYLYCIALSDPQEIVAISTVNVNPFYILFLPLSTKRAAFVLYIISGLGITAGAHRLWSHRLVLSFLFRLLFGD